MNFLYLSITLLLFVSCSSEKVKRKPANQPQQEGEYKVLRLTESYTFRKEDTNGVLVAVETLPKGDVIRVRVDNPTGILPYANGDDIVDSKSGWFQNIEVLRTQLSSDRMTELNSMQLFTSVNILNKATPLRKGELELDCQTVKKGCLLKRNSDTVIIFFRGFRNGSSTPAPENKWTDRAAEMMLNPKEIGSDITTSLSELELESSIFTLASYEMALSSNELEKILKASNANYFIFAAHSGGHRGLDNTLKAKDFELSHLVKSVWMLDNFYRPALARTMSDVLGINFLKEYCFGFVTAHKNNEQRKRYDNHFKNICPNVLTRGVSHTSGVIKCMPYFERDEPCSP